MRVQIVLHQHDLFGFREHLGYSLHEPAIIAFGSLFTGLDQTLSTQRLEGDQQGGTSATLIFIIKACRVSVLHGEGCVHLAEKLYGQFVETDNRALVSKSMVIEVQEVFQSVLIFTCD